MKRSDPQQRLLKWFEENAWWAMLLGLPGLMGLLSHFAKWSPAEVIGLTAVLVAAAIAVTGLLFWRRVRLVQADSALKQSMLERGLTPDEIERLLSCQSEPPQPPRTDEQAIEELAACLHQSDMSETVIEEVFAAMRAAEPPIRQSLCSAIQGLSGDAGDEADDKEILAAIRGFSRNGHRLAEVPTTAIGESTGM